MSDHSVIAELGGLHLSGLQSGSSGELKSQPSLGELAQQFEAIFLAQLLKVMRESVSSSALGESAPGQDIQSEMMDKQLAQDLARQGGFGLARQIEEYLQSLQVSETEEGTEAADPAAGPAHEALPLGGRKSVKPVLDPSSGVLVLSKPEVGEPSQ